METTNAISQLNALSPLDGRYRNQVEALSEYFSEMALIKNRLRVELDYLLVISALTGHCTTTLGSNIVRVSHLTTIEALQVKNYEKTTKHDVKALEYHIRAELKKGGATEAQLALIHAGLTSEDVNNLAYGMMVRRARDLVLIPLLVDILTVMLGLVKKHAGTSMLARTHGQPATPTTLGKEMAVFAARLGDQVERIKKQQISGKLNGATGTYAAMMLLSPLTDWRLLTDNFILSLGLVPCQATTQIEPHDTLVELLEMYRHANNILIGFAQDMWRYISDEYFLLARKEGEIGSSTMPHKVNPIDFENAEGNFGLANALITFMSDKLTKSRLQRDLSDSTVLRNLGVVFGYTMIGYKSILNGLGKVVVNEEKLSQDLENHPEVLAEAYQTVMRLHGQSDGYEAIKKAIGKKYPLQAIMDQVTVGLPEETKNQLHALKPRTYIGDASRIALAAHENVMVQLARL